MCESNSDQESISTEGLPEFGKGVHKEFFLPLSGPKAISFINAGSFGVVPKSVLAAKQKYEEDVECDPDVWGYALETSAVPSELWMNSLQKVANFLHAKVENLVFVRNVTEASNTILKSMKWQANDWILGSDLNYCSLSSALSHLNENPPPHVLRAKLRPLLHSKELLLAEWERCLDQQPRVRLALIELIACPVPVMLPLKEMLALCRDRGVLTHVDAAHAPCQIPLDFEALGADSIGVNLYKWAFCPRPSAVLWVAPQHQQSTVPLVSAAFQNHGFHHSFSYPGTPDHSGFLAVADGVKFIERMGGVERIVAYNKDMLDKAVPMLVEKFETGVFDLPADMVAPSMRLIRLPAIPGFSPNEDNAESLRKRLHDEYRVSTYIFFLDGFLWTRVACHIFNTMQDYERLASAVLDIIRQAEL